MTTTNEDLIAEARAGSMEDRAWMIDVIERLADALAAVPAEGDRDALIHLLGTQPFSASSFEDFF